LIYYNGYKNAGCLVNWVRSDAVYTIGGIDLVFVCIAGICDPNAVAAPMVAAASAVGSRAFTANWSIVSGATGYRLDVSANSTFSSYIPGYSNLDVGNLTTRIVSGVGAGTTNYYRVRAYNAARTSTNSGIIAVTTIPPPPALGAATNISSSGFTAKWSSANGATGYRLDASANSTFSSYVSGYQDLAVSNVLSQSASGLNAGTVYYYRVRAYNTSGTSSNSATNSVTTVPAAPTANAATTVTSGGFTANWGSATGAMGYRLEVSTNASFVSYVTGYSNVDVGRLLSQTVSGLSAGTAYYYRVRAYNSGGTSDSSGTVGVSTIPPLLSSVLQSGNIVLAWGTNTRGFALEYTTNLASPNWTSNPASPPIVNGQYTVTNPPTGARKFFRLKK